MDRRRFLLTSLAGALAAPLAGRRAHEAAHTRRGGVSLLAELDAFYVDHRRCGDLDAGVDGPVVWFGCECGARIARRADDGDAFDVDA